MHPACGEMKGFKKCDCFQFTSSYSDIKENQDEPDYSFLFLKTLLFYFLCMHAGASIWLFVTPWTVAHKAPLSMRFSRQEYWSGLPSLLLGIFPTQGLNSHLLLFRWILYCSATRKVPCYFLCTPFFKEFSVACAKWLMTFLLSILMKGLVKKQKKFTTQVMSPFTLQVTGEISLFMILWIAHAPWLSPLWSLMGANTHG